MSGWLGFGTTTTSNVINQFAQAPAAALSQLSSTFSTLEQGITNSLPTAIAPSVSVGSVANGSDTRVRLGPLNPNAVYGGGSSIIASLQRTGGVLFPYTPTIGFNQTVDYTTLQLVHSNTDYQAYTRTPSVKISVSGKFTVQNQQEGQYALAVLHFLRTVSKSYFGEIDAKSGNAGMPPPVLVFSGYGNYMFNSLRVILNSHSWTFDDSVDYIEISVSDGGIAKLPALFTVSCELMVVQTPQRMMKEFSFGAFASGQLMQSGNSGWI